MLDDFGPPSARLRRRVVVTGLGVVCSLGVRVQAVWQRLLDGEDGVRKMLQDELPEVSSSV